MKKFTVEKKKNNNNTNKNKNKNKTKELVQYKLKEQTHNYAPCWEGWFVEVRELEETAVGITAGSDDNTSVKEHDKITDTRNCFQLFEYYISYCLTLLPLPSLCVLVRIDISE